MATLEEFLQELKVQMDGVKERNLETYQKKSQEEGAKIPQIVFQWITAMMDDIPEAISGVCAKVLAGTAATPVTPVTDPTKRAQIGPTLAIADQPERKVRIMLEEVE